METKEQVLNALRCELNKWLRHSIRGMKSGNPAYFQGKITLIHDLLDFIHDIDFGGLKLEGLITFRLKCEPSVTVTVPETLVREESDCWAIDFRNENDVMQTIIMLTRIWEKEEGVGGRNLSAPPTK